jgi:chromosome segregation ATPase
MPVDTDTAVETEVVETPPVKIFVPEEPQGRRRMGGRLAAFVALVAILAIGGVAAFGYTANRDLGAMRTTLASTEGELGSTNATLQSTTGELGTRTTTLTTAKTERETLDAKVADLSAQVSSQTKCVSLQTAALAELSRISQLQTDNNNRTAEGSTWAKAETKSAKATTTALDAYYQAYSKSFDRNLSSARAWAAKGKEAQGVIATQTKQQAAEFALIDRSAKEIETAINALEQQLKITESTCEAVN